MFWICNVSQNLSPQFSNVQMWVHKELLNHKDSHLIDRLIHGWVHSWVKYWKMVDTEEVGHTYREKSPGILPERVYLVWSLFLSFSPSLCFPVTMKSSASLGSLCHDVLPRHGLIAMDIGITQASKGRSYHKNLCSSFYSIKWRGL